MKNHFAMRKSDFALAAFGFAILFTPIQSVAAEVGGCAPSDFIDVPGNAVVEISGMEYTPRCLKVKSGALVTLPGSKRHPVQGGTDVNGVQNPFRAGAGSTDQVSRTLSVTGSYIYYCTKHGDSSGSGMFGVIQVVE